MITASAAMGGAGGGLGAYFLKVQRSPSADLFLVTVTAGIMSEGARVALAAGGECARWGMRLPSVGGGG